jgi:hypothetical protein
MENVRVKQSRIVWKTQNALPNAKEQWASLGWYYVVVWMILSQHIEPIAGLHD